MRAEDFLDGASSNAPMSAEDFLGPSDSGSKPPKQNTGIVGDIGTALKRGVLQMPGMATGLADIAAAPVSIATGVNRPVSRAADWLGEQTGFQPGKWAEAASAEYSPEMQQAQQNVEQAKGFFPTLGAVAQNPRVAAQVVAESLPSTIAGGLLARGAMGAVAGAEKLAALRAAAGSADAAVANAARRELLRSGAIAAGVGEGAVTAGQQMVQTGYDVDPALAAGAALGAGVGTGIIGGLSGRIASSAIGRKIGLSDIETSMAAGTLGENAGKAGAAGLAKRIGAGAIQEGLLEEAPQSYQEQVWQNLAAGKPLTEGAAEAAALGAVAGGVMGAGVNIVSGPLTKAVAAAPGATVPPAVPVSPAGIASAAQFPQFTAPPQPVTGGAPLEQAPTAMPVPQATQNAPAAPGSPSPVSAADPLPSSKQAEAAGAPQQRVADLANRFEQAAQGLDDLSQFSQQEIADVRGRRAGIVSGQKTMREARLEAADARVETARQKETEAKRNAILDSIDLQGETNIVRRFEKALAQNGIAQNKATPEDRARLARRVSAAKGLSEDYPPIPSAANELVLPEKLATPATASGRREQAIANLAKQKGIRLKGNALIDANGRKRATLTPIEIEAVSGIVQPTRGKDANQAEVAIPPAQGPEAASLPAAAKPAKGIAAALQYPQQVTEGGGPLAQQAADMPLSRFGERPKKPDTSPAIRDANSRESAVAGRARKVLDLRDNETGWKAVDYPNGDGVLLISADGKKAVEFPSKDRRSGTEAMRANASAQAYAIDNPYSSGNTPQNDLVITPAFKRKSEETPAIPVAESVAPAPEAGDGKVAIAQGGAASEIKSRLGIAGALVTPQQPTFGGVPLEQSPVAMPLGEFGKRAAVASRQTPPAEPKSSEWVGASVVFTSPSGRAKRGSVIRVTNGKAVVVSPVGQNYVDLADLKRSKAESTPLKGFPASDNSPGNVKSLDYARQELEQGSPHWYVANALADDVLGDNSKLTSAAFSYVRDADSKNLWKLIDSVAKQLGEGASNNGNVRRAAADFVARQTPTDAPQQPLSGAGEQQTAPPYKKATARSASHYRVRLKTPLGNFDVFVEKNKDSSIDDYKRDAKNAFAADSNMANLSGIAQISFDGNPEPVSDVSEMATVAKNAKWARIAKVEKAATQPQPKPRQQPQPAPIMRRDDLVGAIMRVTGGDGINSNMALTIAGDTAGRGLSKLRGLFTNRGTIDLGEVATRLREDEGFDVRDGEHLSELIRAASFGDTAVSMGRASRDQDTAEDKRHRDYIRQNAKKLKIKSVAVKFTDLEQRVIAALTRRHERAVELLDERAKKRFDAALEESYALLPEDVVDAVLVDLSGRGLSPREFWNQATETLRYMVADARAQKEQEELNAIEGAEPDWLKDDDGRGNQPAGGRGEADRVAEEARGEAGFDLAAQTPEEIAAAEAAAKSSEAKAEKEKKAADDAQKKAELTAEVKKRSEAAAETFELGGNAMDNLTGQKDIFAAPAPAPVEPKPAAKDMAKYITVAAESIGKLRKDDVFRVLVESNRKEIQNDLAEYIKAERPDLSEEVDSVLADERQAEKKPIGDIGEKIGGARKDMAPSGVSGGSRKNDDSRPAWARRFDISQIVTPGGMIGQVPESGRWVIRDEKNLDWRGAPKQVGSTFATKEKAEAFIPIAAVSLKHRVVSVARKDQPEIDVDAMLKADINAKAEDDSKPGKIEYGLMESAKARLANGRITQADFDRLKDKYGEAAAQYTQQPERSKSLARNETYEIWRDISDRKRVKIVDKQFDSRDDAMRYMLENAVQIIETNTTFGEADIPLPPNKQRSGPARRTGNVSGEDFKNTFGLRAVEFGNWNNQDDRQSLMNDAWDGLMDLADVLGIPAKALGLNGDLALAFGARGQGLNSARAHYEGQRVVINLTKEKGAGSLAHEWFHAMDHYFGRQDGKAAAEWQPQADGTRILKGEHGGEKFISSGFGYKSKVRPELREAYDALMKTIFKKAETYVEDTAKADKFTGTTREELARQLDDLRKELSEQKDPKYWKRNNKPASAELLAEFDTIAKAMIDGDVMAITTDWRMIKPSANKARAMPASRWTNDSLERLSAIYKEVRGRSGFDGTNKQGVMDRLGGYMTRYSQRLKMLADAQAGAEKQRMVPTSFAMNAKELDQGRGGDYWTTPHEMAARAFQGYVEDKIAELGGTSRFLNYAPENAGILTPWGAKIPFPAGQERKAINAALDKFVGALQTREDDGGNVALFSFAGQQSATADQFQLDRAKQLLADGANANSVRQQTGWFKGVDGKWRYEISDDSASLTMPYKTWSAMVTERNGGPMMYSEAEGTDKYPRVPLDTVIDHPALFAAYPKLRNVQVFYDLSLAAGQNEHIDHDKNEIGLSSWLTDEKILSSLLHEIQHGIQNVEGFASGGNPKIISAEIDGLVKRQMRLSDYAGMGNESAARELKKVEEKLKSYGYDAYAAYRKLAGEVESRNVQQRQNFTADKRKYSDPLGTQDVAPEDVIVMFNGKDAKDAPAPANTTRASAMAAANTSPSDSAVYQMAQEGKTAAEILAFLAKASRRPFNRVLAVALQKAGLQTSITVDPQGGWSVGNRSYSAKYAAAYSPKADKVALFTPRDAERHALHELTHAATLKAINAGGAAAMRMTALFKHVEKSGKLEGMYGMSTLDEFVAEVFSNPKFRAALESVPATAGSTLKTAWDWFVRIVARVLGFQSNGPHTALDRALRDGVALMDENAAIRAQATGGDRYGAASTKDAKEASEYEARLFGGSYDNNRLRGAPKDAPIRKMIANARQRYNELRKSAGLQEISDWTKAPKARVTDVDNPRYSADDLPPTITVDGVERPTTNSNGKPIHWSEEGVRNFYAWFGKSKAVDADGRPLVVYHGAKEEFSKFNLEMAEQDVDGIWLTDTGGYASWVASGGPGGKRRGVVMDLYLRAENPMIFDILEEGRIIADQIGEAEPKTSSEAQAIIAGGMGWDTAVSDLVREAKSDGRDALIIKSFNDGYLNDANTTTAYVAFDPNQIKSATANTGAFSEDPDIRYSLATNWQQSPVVPGNLYQAAKKKAASLLTPERLDKVIYEMQDKFVDLRRIRDHIKEIGGTITDLNDAYLGEELYHKRLAYRTEQFLKEELQPFFADMKARGVTMPEFEKFLHARHAPEANNEMAKRNPNQNQIDAGRQKSAATVRGLELNLQTAKARGLATVAIEKALTDARAELVRWNSAQAFKGTEAERLSLSGMSNADARALMASLTPAQRSNMDALAAKVDAINEGTLQTLERYGLMDKTALNTWRNTYKHYVPLHRDEAHPDSVSHPIGQGFNVRGDASKRRTGSNQEVTNIFSHIAMQREAALTRGEKNRVMQKLYLMARQNPIPEIWSVGKVPMIDTIDKATGFVRSVPDPQYKDKPNVITLRIGGKDVAIVMNEYNPQALRLAQSIKNLDVDDLHYLIPVVGKATRWFASINTQYNPIFGLINFARDVQTAALNLSTTEIAGKQKEVFKDTMSILGDIIKNKGRMPTAGRWAPIYQEFNEVGGTTGYRDLFLTAEDRSKAVTDEIKALDRGKISQAAHAVAGWLSDYNEAMENATRLAAYKAAIDNGMSKERAASLAKNLTVNFNRKGRQTRELGALYAFFNAAVQGTARMAQTLSGPAGKKIMLGGVLAGAASAMAGIAAMGGSDGEDDEWSKIPEFVKERSFIIPAGKDKYIAIPMPLGFHFLPNIGRLMVEMAVYKDKTLGKQMASLFTVLADAFNPLGGSAPPMQIIAPTVMDPFIALAQNKDWTGKPIYVENFNSLNPQPGSARAKDSATPIAKGMADIINSVTGGTKYVPGGWSPTPDQIDYVIGQLTGGIGREIGKLSSTIAAPFTGDELPAHKIPLLGRLYGSTAGATGQAGKFYENIKRANEVENELKGRRKDGIGVDDYLRENPKAVELAARGNAAERQIRALRQMRSRIVEAGGTDAAGKARQINERMATVMRGFNMQVERMQ